MTAVVEFVLALHDHQPVGNFDHVIEAAYETAYLPMLEALERHPRVQACLHHSGVLWDWLEHHHPEYIDRVGSMVDRDQLELLGGGYYEPILPVIPLADRLGQIEKLSAYLDRRFGVVARGAWLAERVWEPHLAESLARAGLLYSVVDDAHFKSTGLDDAALHGHFVTEDNGWLLHLFPIRQRLRYLLPFAEPEETLTWLREAAEGREDALLVHADDGEKFGVWPGTREHCWEHGWTERFLSALEANASWLRTTTFTDRLDRFAPVGRTYLPTASYAEMSEWVLPPAGQERLRRARASVEAAEDGEALSIFVRGGFWRNFLAKYDESNWMHKRMLWTGQLLEESAAELPASAYDAARDELWQAQCNCAYWHGLFGGLYLPHLRHAIYRHLLRAEQHLPARTATQCDVVDFDADGRPEVLLRNADLGIIVKPDRGGAVFEVDSRPHALNVLDTMQRREEAYHAALRHLAGAPADGGPQASPVSIHDRVAVKESGLEAALIFDRHRPGAFLDHLFTSASNAGDAATEAAALDAFDRGELEEAADLVGAPYRWCTEEGRVTLGCRVPLRHQEGTIEVEKNLWLEGSQVVAAYVLRMESGPVWRGRFGIETVVNLLAGDAPDRWVEVDGQRPEDARLRSRGVVAAARVASFHDAWLGVRVDWAADRPATLWRLPIETVSNSESGFERVYQGSRLVWLHDVELRPETPCELRVTLQITSRGAP